MSLRGKSIFIGSLSFFCFALLRYFIPLRNMGFFVAACIVFVLAAVLYQEDERKGILTKQREYGVYYRLWHLRYG